MIYMYIFIFIVFVLLVIGIKKFNKSYDNEKFAINDALLNHEELMNHAKVVSKGHVISNRKKNYNFLFSRLNENYKFISSVYEKLNEDAQKEIPLCPASEWLLDNFYIVEEHYKDLRLNIGDDFLKELNIINKGPLKGYPRAFAIGLELISHTDGRIDKNQLIEFVESYQSINLLSMAEIWSLFPMLRIALIEKIRYICEKILSTQIEWEKVDNIKLKSNDDIISDSIEYINGMKSLNSSFIEHLLNILKKSDFNSEAILNSINNKLIEFDTNVQKIINFEYQEQAGLQISMGNCITSLRLVNSLDCEEIFEDLSFVENILKNDPSGTYPYQDYESRDYYRHQIELLSKEFNISETKIARTAIYCAQKSLDGNSEFKLTHIGYYILGDGIKELISILKNKNYKTMVKKNPFSSYFLSILLPSMALTLIFLLYAHNGSTDTNLLLLILSGLIVLIISSEVVITILNKTITRIKPAAFLPKLEYKNGIPDEYATVVIIPTLIPNKKRAIDLIEQLEVTYLANNEKNIFFALVGDLKDSTQCSQNEDEDIIETSLSKIDELNKKYASENNLFYFFMRERAFVPSLNKWMGYERKRGAIIEFNNLIKGSSKTSYKIISGDIEPLSKAKYVITLDADTIMPIGIAKKLIGTISHPINKAFFDEKRGIVTDGYGLIQPRIGLNITSTNKSLFSRIFAGHGGVDPYTNAISDVYQDLFGEGIFTGKGIYDIDIFRRALNDSIPDNTVLSHDLLEGSYIRTGLATDIELIDCFPEKYSSYMLRLHRWVRGDWQLLPWLLPRVRNKNGQKIDNPLSTLSRWKIFDNLRRSIISVCLMLMFIIGILIYPEKFFIYAGFAILTIFLPLIINIFDHISPKHSRFQRERLNGNLIYGLRSILYEKLLALIFLPYHCYMMIDAIFKTLYRVIISKKNMLEWVTAADVEKNIKNDLKSFIYRMYPSLIIVYCLPILAFIFNRNSVLQALILAIFWSISPLAAYRISKPDRDNTEALNEDEIEILRRISRKTWYFYETFANEEDNYLPPDNYQISPVRRTAHRTSPTNIGFLLISTLAARDLGYISIPMMINRINATMSTLEGMEKWHGHLYNWYDTKSLKILRPKYISTVDSGNLVSYLITLKEGLDETLTSPLYCMKNALGFLDTILIAEDPDPLIVEHVRNFIQSENFDISKFYNLIDDIYKKVGEGNRCDRIVHRDAGLFLQEITTYFPFIKMNKEIIDFIENSELNNAYSAMITSINNNPSILNIKINYEDILDKIDLIINNDSIVKCDIQFYETLKDMLKNANSNVIALIDKINDISRRVNEFSHSTSFEKLYDAKMGLFSIGFNVDENKLTNSYYDLLASESRTTSYIAISRREVPVSHWFNLGRSLALISGYKGLVSWTGTMFEYFMPALTMNTYENTLLDETYKTVMTAQINYGRNRHVPWGTSESGFYTFDLMLNYQYKAFGVPDLGLKRGLVNDMVVSPYSTFLGLPFSPKECISNLKILIDYGLEGEYGFYEAVDFTPERLTQNKEHAIVESFMAHHQGMTLIALNNYLNKNIMIKRFHASPIIRAGEFLLHERIPLRVIITKEYKETITPLRKIEYLTPNVVRRINNLDSYFPECHLLSNGNYTILVTSKGSGYSKKDDIYVSRWREEISSGSFGFFIFLKDISSNKYWSSAYEPLRVTPDKYEARFSSDKTEFFRVDGNILTHTEICVSPEDNCEIRKVTITNNGLKDVTLECTSYLEIVLANHMSDIAHPAFSNLFIRTEVLNEYNSLLASRRPREESGKTIFAFHTACIEGEAIGMLEYETDRYKYIGRGNDIANSSALNHPLSNTVGPVLDPIMSLRRRIRIEPEKSATITFIAGTAESKDNAIELAKKYNEISNIKRSFELAYIRSEMATKYLNLKNSEVECYENMLSHIVFISPVKRKYEEYIVQNKKGQPGLWSYGISGDIPIILVTIKDTDDIDVVKDMVKAHEYFRTKSLRIDLIILNEDESSYIQPLENLIRDIVLSSNARDVLNAPGGIFIKNAQLIPKEDITLFYSCARIIIKAELGSIKEQIKVNNVVTELPEQKEFTCKAINYPHTDENLKLNFFNEYGGFSSDGYEYVIRLKENVHTPAPWINVISNKSFGFLATEGGSGYTWSENSRENKLTHWSNDPVIDAPSEIIYIRNEKTGESWNITPLPIRESSSYKIIHGMGYTTYEHISHGIEQYLTMFVPINNDKIKVSLVKLKNTTDLEQEFSIFYYIKPVLGVSDQITQQYIVSEFIEGSDVIALRNPYNSDFPNRIAFVDTSLEKHSCTTDRIEFLGSNGSLKYPIALTRKCLSGKLGGGFYPCCATQNIINIKPGEEIEFVMLLGQDEGYNKILELASKYRDIEVCKEALSNVKSYWKGVIGTIQVKTPDSSMNIIMNSWLLYQTTACRLWARSAFYQSGGAFGFRDQLQDILSLINILPAEARNQILLHCEHQFIEGDVQHWWHPGTSDKGIRTKFSDDLLWLPFTVSEYIEKTGDLDILNEVAYYIEDEPLKPEEDERYGIPRKSTEKSNVYEHCIRAIEKALKFGEHGLPLMGSGDWNDGMNTVGNKGKGESVWMGWFLSSVLLRIAPYCKAMNEMDRAEDYIKKASEISSYIEEKAWDGSWYRRAYFDDGTPLGSSINSECKIDSLAQSWAVISGLADNDRIKTAMSSLEDYLIRRDEGLILLFTPPFDSGDLKPGYIRGYVPGVRENGGQYTHAATWVIYAFAKMGCGDKAMECFKLINPITHTMTQMECARYKVEPYVMAADVYAVDPHTGRGGWTWYTGSSSWMYKIGLEEILGFKKKGKNLIINPCIPKDWMDYSIQYRYSDTLYNIIIKNPDGVSTGVKSIYIDNIEIPSKEIQLDNNSKIHTVEVILGNMA